MAGRPDPHRPQNPQTRRNPKLWNLDPKEETKRTMIINQGFMICYLYLTLSEAVCDKHNKSVAMLFDFLIKPQ